MPAPFAAGGSVSRRRATATNGGSIPRPPPTDDQLLVLAGELVARGWCQRALAEDRFGRPVEPWSASACCWSLLGALTRVWHEGRGRELDVFEAAYASLAIATGGRPEEWNAARWRTRWHVVRAFARAREFLPEARQQVRARRSSTEIQRPASPSARSHSRLARDRRGQPEQAR